MYDLDVPFNDIDPSTTRLLDFDYVIPCTQSDERLISKHQLNRKLNIVRPTLKKSEDPDQPDTHPNIS